MAALRTLAITLIPAVAALAVGCTDESASLKQKISVLEKRIEKQEKQFEEFVGKLVLPKDYSVDIQRLEDRQEQMSEGTKTKLESVESKLEEFRDWAQETQKDRDAVSKRLSAMEKDVSEVGKAKELSSKYIAQRAREAARLKQELVATQKKMVSNSKAIETLGKTLERLRRDVLENNTKMVSALKNVLPKVKDAAVDEMKKTISSQQLEINTMRAELDRLSKGGKAVAAQAQAPAVKPREVRGLRSKIDELEGIVAAQKDSLLGVAAKVHELENALSRALPQR